MLKRWISIAFLGGVPLSIAASMPQISAIKIERTACMGTCPIYSVAIFSDGRLQYKGEMFVKAKGIRTKKIPVAQFQKLAAKVDEINFSRLDAAYPTQKTIADAPSTFITVTRGTVSKRVEDYMDAPKRLRELEKLIDQVANVSNWVDLSEEAAAREWDRAMRRAYR